jgi:hypothetical protein
MIKTKQMLINESRLSTANGSDTSAVFFNNGMVLVLLERNKITRECLFFRPNTYDYVIAHGAEFSGYLVTWAHGDYIHSITEVAKYWRA